MDANELINLIGTCFGGFGASVLVGHGINTLIAQEEYADTVSFSVMVLVGILAYGWFALKCFKGFLKAHDKRILTEWEQCM